MKSEPNADRGRQVGGNPSAHAPAASRQSGRFTATDLFALIFGVLLGLALIKFGNPVILEKNVPPPRSISEWWSYGWPPSWSVWLLTPLAIAGGGLAVVKRARWPATRWLWVWPTVWFAWQLVSATRTVDKSLTANTLWHFGGCAACFFLGALTLGTRRALRWLLVAVLAAFTFCLVRAVMQKRFEFPREYQVLLEGERTGWTNFPPDLLLELKNDGVIVRTNGVEIANPVLLEKYRKGRVMGTLVYPNALAGIVLLLWPLSITLAFSGTLQFRRLTRLSVILLTLFLGGAGLFWSGSKFGWLLAVGLAGVWLLRLDWPARWKVTAAAAVFVVGLAVFLVRFHSYFSAGATSVGARFDYWRAAVQATGEHPIVGSGPGTFQHPYARLKAPESEMARLTHDDYLQQFSDSGIIGGLSYLAWISFLLVTLGRRTWRPGQALAFALFLGLLGWFVQGLTEFGLYIPALAWTAFTLGGCALGATGNEFDKAPVRG